VTSPSPCEHNLAAYRRGCRCATCRAANAAKARRNRARAYLGTAQTPVDARRARDHVVALRGQGMGIRSIAADSGVSRSQVRRLALGLVDAVTPRVEAAILAVRPAPRYVPARGTRVRIQALAALGYPLAWVNERMGRPEVPRGNFLSYHATTTRRDRAAAVIDILRAVGDTPGPSRHVTAMAKTFGWRPPIAYDEERLFDVDWDGRVASADVTAEQLLMEEYTWLRAQHPQLTMTAAASRLKVSHATLRKALAASAKAVDEREQAS
jgi:hypothetical protein